MAYGVAEYERDAERYCQAAALEWSRYWSGRTGAPDLPGVFRDWGFLFGTDLIEQLGQEEIAPNRRSFLVAFATEGSIARATCRELTRLAAEESTAGGVWEGDEIALWEVPARLANLADPQRRRRLDQAAREAIARSNPTRQELLERRREALYELGPRNPMPLWDTLFGLNLESLNPTAQRILDQTEATYRDTLQGALRLGGLQAGDTWAADLAWLVRGADYDLVFPTREVALTARRTLLPLGQRLEEQDALSLDLEARAHKWPGAWCQALHVPRDIVATISPLGGWHDVAELLGVLGEAEFLANMDPALPMPYRWLGDPALARGYGYILKSLVGNALWLAARVELGDPTDFQRRFALSRLIEVRSDAVSMQYEQRLARADSSDWEPLQQDYVESFGAALGAHHAPEAYLQSFERPLVSIQSLRGAIFGAQLLDHLVREYDEDWFGSLKAGRFLVELWREGTRYTAEEMLRFMGYDDLDPAHLIRQLSI